MAVFMAVMGLLCIGIVVSNRRHDSASTVDTDAASPASPDTHADLLDPDRTFRWYYKDGHSRVFTQAEIEWVDLRGLKLRPLPPFEGTWKGRRTQIICVNYPIYALQGHVHLNANHGSGGTSSMWWRYDWLACDLGMWGDPT